MHMVYLLCLHGFLSLCMYFSPLSDRNIMNYSTTPRRDPFELKPLVNADAKFYGKCSEHKSKDCNIYCLSCKRDPICILCCEDYHKHHLYLQVFRTTHKNALRSEDMKEYMRVKDIHKLKNNGAYVCLIARRVANRLQSEGHHSNGECMNCGFKVWAAEPDVQFCSIECKLEWLGMVGQIKPVGMVDLIKSTGKIRIKLKTQPTPACNSVPIEQQNPSSFQGEMATTSGSAPPDQQHPASPRNVMKSSRRALRKQK